MLIQNRFHLTYCTNIHPGQNWESTFASLKEFVPGIKRKVSNEAPFGLGLRLSNKASEELNEANHLSEFKLWLQENKVYVFTMNGFPYGNFHNERVKDDVHSPDWTTKERVDYTKRLFTQLAELLPEGLTGGISTSPISYKHWHSSKEAQEKAYVVSAHNYSQIVMQLYELELNTGKYLHLDIEPEPDGLLENSDEVLKYFKDYLVPIGIRMLNERFGKDGRQAEEIIKRYLTVCYDICHFSLAYEEPEYTFEKLNRAGIFIGKIQVSAALKIIFSEENGDEIWESLSHFDEPTYLHQVTELIGGKVRTYNDLPIVLGQRKEYKELRAHFHVPIFLEKFDKLYATQDHILKVVEYLKDHEVSEHLEIETYTWDVLPASLKRDLSDSIVREINWLKERL